MAQGNGGTGPGLAALQSMVGRFQAPELFNSVNQSFTTPSQILIPRTLNLTRPLESITIYVAFRIAVTVANFTAVAPEAPQNILQRITLTGTHRAFGAVTPMRLRGATAYVGSYLAQGLGGSDIVINNTRAASPGRPLTSPFLGTTAGSPYDIIVVYHLPVTPQLGLSPAIKRQQSAFLYLPQDWGDSLQLQLEFGDASALGNPTGATTAFTAFGSGTGTPLVEVHLNYSILGQFANQMNNGVVLREERELSTFTALATAQRLATLQKNITTGILVKSGTTQTAGLTAGVNTYATVVDTQLARTQVIVDNKPVRNNQNNTVMKAYYQRMFGTVIPAGYQYISFVDGQSALLGYRGDLLAPGSQFELYSDIATASADNRQSYLQEQIIGGPFPSRRP